MKYIYKFLIIGMVIIFSSCEDELERLPKDELTIPTTFTTYNNIQTYSWSFYNYLGDYERGITNRNEHAGDLMMNGRNPDGNDWLWNRMIVPSSSNNWDTPYAYIRKVNIMLDNLEASELSERDMAHWKSVGYFFRSLYYFDLLKRYGGVPWIDKAISDGDQDYLFAPRNSRDEVANRILADLEFAEANIKTDGEGAGSNTVNVHTVRALISRFGLFEGTWRKYHGLSDTEKFLNACISVSEKVISDFPALHANYDELYNSDNLKGVDGIILYRQYVLNEYTHSTTQYMRSSWSPYWDMTKKAADMFLLKDGQTRWTSPLFEGDKDPYTEFRNRDHRMYFILTPPYEVVGNVNGNKKAWDYTENEAHREYIDLMKTISNAEHKLLPENNWGGNIQPIMPNYRDAGTQNLSFDPGYNVTSSGYKFWKWYNNLKVNDPWKDECDQPLFRVGEVMLNYAEAKFEMGSFDQTVADKTINLLRERGAVAAMVVADITSSFDPGRNQSVEPVLWEIRRERAVELMGDGFRFDDLRRWKMMNDEAAKEKLGRYIVSADFNNKLPVQGGADEGYISRVGVPPAFPDHYYLYPIPSDQIVLNDKLKQNPGWE